LDSYYTKGKQQKELLRKNEQDWHHHRGLDTQRLARRLSSIAHPGIHTGVFPVRDICIFLLRWFQSHGRDGYMNGETVTSELITTYDQIKSLEQLTAQQYGYDHVVITFYTLLCSAPTQE